MQLTEEQKAYLWDLGFVAGMEYGQQRERHDPKWDYYEPTRPENPYRKELKCI